MIEVHPKLFVGSQLDYETRVHGHPGWRIVHACKEPYHRQTLGYGGRGAPKDHPEYLIARRDDRLILNLVDANDPRFIPDEIIDAALGFIHESLAGGRKVLVHCNLGESRGPSIALLYMAAHTNRFRGMPFDTAVEAFRGLYPAYHPAAGIKGYVQNWWSKWAPP